MTERLKTAAIVALLAALAGSIALAATDGAAEVRINARQLDDGRVEFALQQRTDGEWGERQFPRARYFPADATVGRWLNSSPLTVSVASAADSATTDDIVGTAYFSIENERDNAYIVVAEPGIYAVGAIGWARAGRDRCDLYLTVVGKRGVADIQDSEDGGSVVVSYLSIGNSTADDLEPGILKVNPIGCAAYVVQLHGPAPPN